MSVRVQICRGCCCGTVRKHPDVDHDAHVARLGAVARVRVVDCVDECSMSNVVVVRRRDAPSTWLGRILDDEVLDELCGWLEAGAHDPVPAALVPHVFVRGVPSSVPAWLVGRS
jgi:hypothetical protein